jgi:hypothetical protein
MALHSNAGLRLHKALFYNLFFQFLILRLLIRVCTQFHHLFLVVFLSTSQRIIIKYLNYSSFNIHSINMTNPIQPTYSNIQNNISISKQLQEFLIIYLSLQFSSTLIPPHILLKLFLSKAASRVAIYRAFHNALHEYKHL